MLGRVIDAVDPDPKLEVLVEARMLVAPQQPPTAPLLALARSRLDEGRSPRAAEGLESVGVGSGLAVFMVQASPRPPAAETPTPPVQVGVFLVDAGRHPVGDGLAEGRLRTGLLEVLIGVEHGDAWNRWTSRCTRSATTAGCCRWPLPAELVATGAMVTGALAALLLLVPQIWAVPVARLTSWIE